jgi:uncharacterized protein YodC (DUF2158 family)
MSGIKEGDVVVLRSAATGPVMTVGAVKDGVADCFWNAGKELRRESIPVAALRQVGGQR